ncbi:hypothetical protein GCM10022393_32220 [Aquimarina addita]|uniref:Uncharacterized protein n=1 Tax=Aquimarina addita TaxID=870485 RepID=A0ABP6USV2_9FLAO
MDDRPVTFEDHLYQNSFSLTASDVILYRPPSEWSLDPVADKDIIVHYKIGEEYNNATLNINATLTGREYKLKLSTDALNLEALYQILNTINSLQHHKKTINFKYLIINNENVNLLNIIYSDNGEHVELTYL